MGGHHPHERQEHERAVPARRHAQPEHAASEDHAHAANNRQATQTGSERMAMFQQHYAAHRAAQRAAEDGLHPAANAPSPYARQVAHDLAQQMPDYVGAIQAMDRDPDAHERQRLAATITSHLDAHLGRLSMDDLLRTLQPLKAQDYLDQRTTRGDTFQTLLVNAAVGLNKDRLTFALTLLDKDKGLNYLEDRQGLQDAPLPHYLIDHFDDFTGALAYFQSIHQPVGSGTHAPLQSISAYVGSNSGVLWGALEDFSAAAARGVQQAIDAIGDSPADYTVTAEAFVGALLPAAAVLAPETFGASAVIAATLLGAAVTAASTQVSPQETFSAVVLNLMGKPTDALADSFCDRVLNKAEWLVSQVYASAQQQKWTQNRLELEILRKGFASPFLKMRPGGVASLDGDAVTAAVKRDVLLLAVPAAGKVVYDYQVGEGAFDPQNNYTSPATWTYTLTKTVIAVRPELVGALQAELRRGPIEASRIKGPKEFIVEMPNSGTESDFDRPAGVAFTLDDHDNVQTIVPRGGPLSEVDMWSGGRVTRLSPTEFERMIVDAAWRASKGTPPISQVSEVVEHYGPS